MAGATRSGYNGAMAMNEPQFDRDRQRRLPRLPRRRFRRIPVRMLVPNVITLLALCAGLTAIRMAFEDRYTLALFGHRVRRYPWTASTAGWRGC